MKMTPNKLAKAKEKIAKRIASCVECNGNPELEPFILPEFTGTICKKCGLISNYNEIKQ